MLNRMDYAIVDNWMTEYLKAWQTKDAALLDHVFSNEISYKTSPYTEPITGLDAMRQFWLDATDDGEVFTADYSIVAIEGDIAVIKVDVHYTKPHEQHWKDLWILQLDAEGLCFGFEEWPLAPPR